MRREEARRPTGTFVRYGMFLPPMPRYYPEGRRMKRLIGPGAVAAGFLLALAGCTNPYNPAERAVGGGLVGAGAGAAIGAAAGGGAGAATGAAVGGALGAVTGAATTPPPPPGYGPGYPAPGYGPGYPPPGYYPQPGY